MYLLSLRVFLVKRDSDLVKMYLLSLRVFLVKRDSDLVKMYREVVDVSFKLDSNDSSSSLLDTNYPLAAQRLIHSK